jgi:hypothetical protein
MRGLQSSGPRKAAAEVMDIVTGQSEPGIAGKPEDTNINRAEIGRILDAWYDRYRRGGRIDEGVFLALRNRLVPLAPGEPVQFLPELRHGDVNPARRRWLNGTCEGPVLNPDDPNRRGDVIVVSSSGRRASVFLSSVRRQS